MHWTRAKLVLALLIAGLAAWSLACNRASREDTPADEQARLEEELETTDEATDEQYFTEDTGAQAVDIEEPADDTLASREAELAARERELARREAELARRDTAPPPQESWRERQPQPAPAPAPAPTPITVPAGTSFSAELQSSLSSETSQVGDSFTARLSSPLSAGGQVAVPAGSTVYGRVTEAKGLRKIGGRARLGVAFASVTLPNGSSAPLAASLTWVGKSETKKDAATIGGSTAAGAILGKVIGGGDDDKRVAAGAVVGGAVGTVVAAKTKGETIQLPAGTVLTATLEAPVTVTP
ncbi:MAG: hypothetical protein ACRD2Z_04500 [Thermoanaerobaculia bacterium]